MPAPYATHRAQMKAILRAWGMPEDNAEITAEVLAWADLHGVDSHGISMIPGYDGLRRNGRVRWMRGRGSSRRRPCRRWWTAAEGSVTCRRISPCRRRSTRPRLSGMAIAAVRNSAHFGAAGYYTLMAASTVSSAWPARRPRASRWRRHSASRRGWALIPGRSRPQRRWRAIPARYGDDDGRRGPIRNKANERLPTPDGWVLDGKAALQRSAGGQGEGRLPDLARRLAGEFQLQGLWPCGDGEHPGVLPVGRNAHHRSRAHQEARRHGHRAFLHGHRSPSSAGAGEFEADVATFLGRSGPRPRSTRHSP